MDKKQAYTILSHKELEEKLVENMAKHADDVPTSLAECSTFDLLECVEGNGISEIQHDWENADWGGGYLGCKLTGIRSIGDFTFLGVTAGGDWEVPVFSIFFVNGEGKIQAYIPKSGNIFNFITKSAFGNSDSDVKAAMLAYKKRHEDIDGYNNENLLEDIRKHVGIKRKSDGSLVGKFGVKPNLKAITRTEEEIVAGKELNPEEIAINLEVIARECTLSSTEAEKALNILRRAFPYLK